ncbi:MAG: hypothetical protein ACR2P3_09505 [Geminicoccaceae bacterium]
MADQFQIIEADGIKVTLDLAAGHLRSFEIDHNGHLIKPLHTAPWVDDPTIRNDPDIPVVLKHLSGDFFCAPFGESDVDDGPPHGWSANSPWRFEGEEEKPGGKAARFVLDHDVQGARLVKELTLRDGHPFLYVSHRFDGGSGAISVASHAMTRFETRGRLSFSAKSFADLPDEQTEPDPARGHSVFARSARFTDLSKLPLADGGTADLRDYPIAERHEDLVMLVEVDGTSLGWTAAARFDQGDLMLSLKNPAELPVTFLWFSNAGRDYAPWNGRHRGVLGIEEGRAFSIYGHAASINPNPLSDAGIPTSITLDSSSSVTVRHILGGVPLPTGWRDIESIHAADGSLRLTNPEGAAVDHPFDDKFLAAGG